MELTCIDCFYSREFRNIGKLFCYRYPPVTVYSPAGDGGFISIYPEIKYDSEICGEFKRTQL